jgi:hypothetical protein
VSLDPASYPELWRIFDNSNGDLRPEYLLPLMYSESTFDPKADNGVGFYGINQASQDKLPPGVTPAQYKTWPASRQLRQVAGPFFLQMDRAYGPIRSGTRMYQANFVPESTKLAFDFGDTIVARGGKRYKGQEDAFYRQNAASLDFGNKGKITVGDMATAIARSLTHPTVDAAITQAYVVRGEPRPGVGEFIGGCFGPGSETTGIWVPGVGAPALPHNPVYGDDFDARGNYVKGGLPQAPDGASPRPIQWGPIALAAAFVGLTGAALWYIERSPRRNPIERSRHGEVQTLLFSRAAGWDTRDAKAWAHKHGYHAGKTDVTDRYVRLRQEDPSQFRRMRTVSFGNRKGIRAVVGWR